MKIKMNINDEIWVKVTALGRTLPGVAEHLKFDREVMGWSKWQLWDFAATFGPAMFNGGKLPLETEISLANPIP